MMNENKSGLSLKYRLGGFVWIGGPGHPYLHPWYVQKNIISVGVNKSNCNIALPKKYFPENAIRKKSYGKNRFILIKKK